jgi:hypothetical protein
MATRFNSKSSPRYGVSGIADKTHQDSPDLSIPPVGIEDVDVSLFNLFEKEIPLQVSGDNSTPKKVPVIFASGEKWAMLKKYQAIRDRNGSLILPLVTILRNSIAQDTTNDIVGRGINQQTNEIVIRRRLDKSDRSYQNLINRYLVKNQKNVATNSYREHLSDQLLTNRSVGEDQDDPTIIEGGWLADIKSKNIYETIVIPSPRFCSIKYDVTLWTQYTQHMNQLLEQIMSSFLPQGNAWRLDTPKGYWFIATVDGSFDPETNFEALEQEERLVRHKFSVNVNAYIFAGNAPGINVPIKRYVSSPVVTFDTGLEPSVGLGMSKTANTTGNPFLGSDDPTLPLSNDKNRRLDQRNTGTRLYDPKNDNLASTDPALASRAAQQYNPVYTKVVSQDSTGKQIVKYNRSYRVTAASGETVVKPASEFVSKPGIATADAILGGLTYESGNDL